MRYHIPVIISKFSAPSFMKKSGELAIPQRVFTQKEYPNLPDDMVKITAQNGRNIYVPLNKFRWFSNQDI